MEDHIDRFRDRLADQDALPQMVVLGIVAGLAAALLIVAFRWLIEAPLNIAFASQVDNYESLSPLWRFLLPFLGALFLGLIMSRFDEKHHAVSVAHVLDRLHNYQGKIPGSNMLVQFFGGIVALVSGQSVGREGPGVHLGAGVASLLGQYFKLPNNSLRTLVACGSAAAIAASFDTPMAGVVFAMEVILMEYTIAGFIPVILAAVLGSAISQLVFGEDLGFLSVQSQTGVVAELPYLVFCGAVFAVAAAMFIRLHLFCLKQHHRHVLLRFLIIGILTGSVAIFLPQILGTGYDTLNLALGDELGLQLLLWIVLAKLVVTAVATGLGMIGGIIGPTLMMGGCLGAVLGLLGNTLVPGASDPGFYVSLGMVAMMGAVLNAPLAALVAILELSNSPGIIFPAMAMVVVACLGVQLVFSYRGVFVEQLRIKGHDLHAESGKSFLRRVGVLSVMNRSFRVSDAQIDQQMARNLVDSGAVWLVVELEEKYRLMATADLARYLDEICPVTDEGSQKNASTEEPAVESSGSSIEERSSSNPQVIDLEAMPANEYDLALVDSLASLHEASQAIRQSGARALLVIESSNYSESRVVGVMTRETLTSYYGM